MPAFLSDISADTATATEIRYQLKTAGLTRWVIRKSSSAESGGNAGSNFNITRYDDSGAEMDTPVTITRSSGVVTVINDLVINTPAGVTAALDLQTAGKMRWSFGKAGNAESGGNAGSTFTVARYSDAGAWLDNPLEINRADGAVVVAKPLWLSDPTPTSGNHAASKQYVDGRLSAADAGDFVWLFYTAAAPPLAGQCRYNATDTIYLHHNDANGVYRKAENNGILVGDKLYLAALTGAWAEMTVTASTDSGMYQTVVVTINSTNGSLPDGLRVYLYRVAVTKQYVDSTKVNGRVVSSISGATTAGAAALTDYVYLCTAALTLTMPTAVGNKGRYSVKRTGGGTVTIGTTSSQTIDGASTYSLSTANQAIDLISNGANWAVI